ncbi:hypothetical protein COMA2_80003 [Candidatus Nitrospira nitrificans]|uniref:Uncharacterized protein n=1 Tax=Candidatus Nitrospira nitrificans TaxID=1742973 RepID=A0A0S4LSD7_9BACT|nr:hypothetical protein COMA2_80003 [Candidatus Nitrospira nitrificans]
MTRDEVFYDRQRRQSILDYDSSAEREVNAAVA